MIQRSQGRKFSVPGNYFKFEKKAESTETIKKPIFQDENNLDNSFQKGNFRWDSISPERSKLPSQFMKYNLKRSKKLRVYLRL